MRANRWIFNDLLADLKLLCYNVKEYYDKTVEFNYYNQYSIFTEYILTFHSRKSTGVNKKIIIIPFSRFSFLGPVSVQTLMAFKKIKSKNGPEQL